MRTLFKALVILCSVGFASIPVANAAGGCGWGYHRGYYGGCVSNYYNGYYGRWGYPVVYRPYAHRCWRNWAGYVRCGW